MTTKTGTASGRLTVSYNGSFTFKGKPDYSYNDMMTSGEFISTASEVFDPFWPRFDGVDLMFRRMIRGFNEGIRRSFVPTSRSYDVTLMDNKPEIKELKPAYDAAKDGNIQYALDSFLSEWKTSGHVPSGNCARHRNM